MRLAKIFLIVAALSCAYSTAPSEAAPVFTLRSLAYRRAYWADSLGTRILTAATGTVAGAVLQGGPLGLAVSGREIRAASRSSVLTRFYAWTAGGDTAFAQAIVWDVRADTALGTVFVTQDSVLRVQWADPNRAQWLAWVVLRRASPDTIRADYTASAKDSSVTVWLAGAFVRQ